MCILVINKEIDNILLAFNRDETKGKQWETPDKHWPNYANVKGYMDIESQGSWLVYNSFGIVCCLLNRELDTLKKMQSRSHVVLEVIKNAENSNQCLKNWENLDVSEISPFNLIIMYKNEIYYCSNRNKKGEISKVIEKIEDTFVMINRSFPNDLEEYRIKANYARLKLLKNDMIKEWKKIMLESTYVRKRTDELTMSLKAEKWETLCHTIIVIQYTNKQSIVSMNCYDY